MKGFFRVIASIFCVVAAAGPAGAGWRFVSPMPHGRFGHAAALRLDGKIQVMGGATTKHSNDGSFSNLVYDPNMDSWAYLEAVPGYILTRDVAVWEPEIMRWQVKSKKEFVDPASLTRNTDVRREGDGAAIVTLKDGRILWLGGAGQYMGMGESIALTYDPIENRWPEARPYKVNYSPNSYSYKTLFNCDIPDMLDRRIDHEAVVAADGKIYVFGGRQWGGGVNAYGNPNGKDLYVLDTVECYDPRVGRWEYRCPMPNKRMEFAAVLGPDGLIYTFGGGWTAKFDEQTPALDTVDVYDPKTDSWSQRKPMPEPRKAHAGVIGADGRIYILGGSRAHYGPPLRDVLIYDLKKNSWKKGPSMKIPRAVLAAVATPDGKIFAIGGSDVGAYSFKENLNALIPGEGGPFYTGKVQNTVEVLELGK